MNDISRLESKIRYRQSICNHPPEKSRASCNGKIICDECGMEKNQ